MAMALADAVSEAHRAAASSTDVYKQPQASIDLAEQRVDPTEGRAKDWPSFCQEYRAQCAIADVLNYWSTLSTAVAGVVGHATQNRSEVPLPKRARSDGAVSALHGSTSGDESRSTPAAVMTGTSSQAGNMASGEQQYPYNRFVQLEACRSVGFLTREVLTLAAKHPTDSPFYRRASQSKHLKSNKGNVIGVVIRHPEGGGVASIFFSSGKVCVGGPKRDDILHMVACCTQPWHGLAIGGSRSRHGAAAAGALPSPEALLTTAHAGASAW